VKIDCSIGVAKTVQGVAGLAMGQMSLERVITKVRQISLRTSSTISSSCSSRSIYHHPRYAHHPLQGYTLKTPLYAVFKGHCWVINSPIASSTMVSQPCQEMSLSSERAPQGEHTNRVECLTRLGDGTCTFLPCAKAPTTPSHPQPELCQSTAVTANLQ
jgi:hypothetical protein